MSIRKSKSGTGYIADDSLYHNGIRDRIRKIFPTQSEAKDFLADLRKQKKTASNREALHLNVRTISEMIAYYYILPRYKGIEESSQKRNRQLINRFDKWCSDNRILYLHEFTRESAQAYLSYIMDRSVGRGRERHFTAIKMLFAEELERDYPVIHRNPFPKRCPFKKTFYKPIALSELLINQLREHMTTFEKLIFDILYYTGCRTGELLYLTKDQLQDNSVRFGNHLIYRKIDKAWIPWKTKNGIERDVPLNAQAKLAFKQLSELPTSNNYVLPDECRDTSHWFTRHFEKIKKLTVETYPELKDTLFPKDPQKNITPKRFRSTFITHVIRETGSVEKARVLAGHRSIQTTIMHYTDDESLDLKGAVNSLDLDKGIE